MDSPLVKAAVFVGFIAVAGCGNALHGPADEVGAKASSEIEFGPDSENAIVIVGVRSVSELILEDWLSDRRQRWNATWARFEPDAVKFVDPLEEIRTERYGCGLSNDYRNPFGCYDDQRVNQYFVMVAEPGHYALRQVQHVFAEATIFAGEGESLLFEQSLADGIKSGEVPWFQANPGEIVYIGDYVFDVAEHPVSLLRIERSDEVIDSYRARIPGMKGTIHYRGPGGPQQRVKAGPPDGEPSDPS